MKESLTAMYYKGSSLKFRVRYPDGLDEGRRSQWAKCCDKDNHNDDNR